MSSAQYALCLLGYISRDTVPVRAMYKTQSEVWTSDVGLSAMQIKVVFHRDGGSNDGDSSVHAHMRN